MGHTVGGLPLHMALVNVARLAKVQRPVVSMWRSRTARSDTPFPPPVAKVGGEERFDADAVVDWLERTGRGNNPDARADVAGFASPMGMGEREDEDEVVLHGLGALLCLREITGTRLGGLSDEELLDLADDADPDDEYLFSEIEALGERREPLAGYADTLADAAYHGAAAFERLMRDRFRPVLPGHMAVELHETAHELAASLAAALATDAGLEPAVYVDPTAGGSDLLVSLVRHDEGLGSATVMTAAHRDSASRHARRRLRVHGVHCQPLAVDDDGAWAVPRPAVHLAQYPSPGRMTMPAEEVLSAVENIVLQMDDTHRGVVLAPADVLADRIRDRRADELRDALLRQGRVRAIVRLPRGLVVSRPRQALALWVLGPAHRSVPVEQRWTTVADLTDVELGGSETDALVTDLVAAMGDRRMVDAHAFRFGRPMSTRSLLAARTDLVGERPALVAPARSRDPDLPVRVADLVAMLNTPTPPEPLQVELHGARQDPVRLPPITLGQAVTAGHLRVLAGNRLDPSALPGGAARVVGVEELAGTVGWGSRSVDRLAFEMAHPAGRYTEPDDIVFCTSPRPTARVDTEGGSIVVAPARILRIDAAAGELLPEVLAADINAAPPAARSWRSWPVRRVPPTELAALSGALAALVRERGAARSRLELLDEIQELLIRGIATGSLSLNPDNRTEEGR